MRETKQQTLFLAIDARFFVLKSPISLFFLEPVIIPDDWGWGVKST